MISLDRYLGNIKTILWDNPFFTLILALAAVMIAVTLLIPKLRKSFISNATFKILVAVFLCQSLGVLMVAKHSLSRYLLPVLVLGGILPVLLVYMLRDFAARFNVKAKYHVILVPVIILSTFLLINPPSQVSKRGRIKTRVRDKALQMHQIIETQYKDYARVYGFGSSSVRQALNFGNNLAHHAYSKSLSRMYPDTYFYDFITKRFHGFHYSPPIPLGMIRAKHENMVVFNGLKQQKFPGVKLKPIAGTSRESISLPDPEDALLTGKLAQWVRETIATGTTLVVPAELAGSIPGLQKDYRVIFENVKKIHDLHFYRLATLLDQPYFLVPAPPYPGKGSSVDFLTQFQTKAVFPAQGPPAFAMGRPAPVPAEFSKQTRFREIKVWHPRKTTGVSPALYTFKSNGTVTFNYIRSDNRNTLSITAGEPDKTGKHLHRFGYRFNKRGLKTGIPAGKTVYFVAAVKVPAQLMDKENFLFIDEFSGTWKSKKLFFSGTGWMTGVVFAKIPETGTGLRLGMQFSPPVPGEVVLIRDIKVYVSEE